MRDTWLFGAALVLLVGLIVGAVVWDAAHASHYRVELLSNGRTVRQWESTRQPRPVVGTFGTFWGYTFTDTASGEQIVVRAEGGVIVITEIRSQ